MVRGEFAPKNKYIRLDRYFFCHWCGMETAHAIEMCYIVDQGIKPTYVCTHCGQMIPEDSVETYLKTGDVVLKRERRWR